MSDTNKFDPSRRRLCPDGSCVGLLDESGRCKECGRTASGKVEAVEAVGAPAPDDSDDVGFDAELELASEPEDEGASDALAASGGFDPNRKLCPDGSCVGVIGADGKCGVCGQAG
jgi:hypothetical protein